MSATSSQQQAPHHSGLRALATTFTVDPCRLDLGQVDRMTVHVACKNTHPLALPVRLSAELSIFSNMTTVLPEDTPKCPYMPQSGQQILVTDEMKYDGWKMSVLQTTTTTTIQNKHLFHVIYSSYQYMYISFHE